MEMRWLRLRVRLQEQWWCLVVEARRRRLVWLVKLHVVLVDLLWHREWQLVLRWSEVVDLLQRRGQQQQQRPEQEVGVLLRRSRRRARWLVL